MSSPASNLSNKDINEVSTNANNCNGSTNNISVPMSTVNMKRSYSAEDSSEDPPAKQSKSSHKSTLLRGLLDDLESASKEIASTSKTLPSISEAASSSDSDKSKENVANNNDNTTNMLKLLSASPKLKVPLLQNGIGSTANDVIKIDDDEEPSIPIPSFYKCKFDECGICKKSLNNRNPLLLGCLHSFCSECLLQKKHFQFSTTLASKFSQNGKDGASNLPTVESLPNEAFQDLDSLKRFLSTNSVAMSTLVLKCEICECNTRAKVITRNYFVSLSTSKPASETIEKVVDMKLCTNCEEALPAIKYCKDCEEYLCEECVNAHKRTKLTKEHLLEILESAVNDRGIKKTAAKFHCCAIHPNEELKLYCETCCKLTCRDCQLDSHRHHKYMFVKEAAILCAKQLESVRRGLTEKEYHLSNTLKSISAQVENVLRTANKANEDIVAMHSRLQNILTTKCQTFLAKAEQIASFRRSKLLEQSTITNRLAAAVDHCIKFVDFATEEQNSLPLLGAKQMIMEYVTTVMRQKFASNPCVPSDLNFTPDEETGKRVASKLGALVWATSQTNSPRGNSMRMSNNGMRQHDGVFSATSTSRNNSMSVPRLASHSGFQRRMMSSAVRAPNAVVTMNHHQPNMVMLTKPSQNPLTSSHTIKYTRSSNVPTTFSRQKSDVTNAPHSSTSVQSLLANIQQKKSTPAHLPALPNTASQQLSMMSLNRQFTSQSSTSLTSKPNVLSKHSRYPSTSTSTKNGGLVPHIAEALPKPEMARQSSMELKPFVTKVAGSYQPPASNSAIGLHFLGTSQADSPLKTLRPTTKSPTTPPVVGKKPSFLAEVANVTQQQVLPNLMNRILPQNDQLPGTPKKEAGDEGLDQRPSSSDSGIASDSKSEIKTTSTTCSEPSRSVLAPPKLIDLANIFGTGDEEPQQNKNSDKVNNQNVTKVTATKPDDASAESSPHDLKDGDSDNEDEVSKLLSSLAQEQKNETSTVKKEETDSFPESSGFESTVGKDVNSQEPSSTSNDDEKYLYEENAEERTFDPNEDWCAVCNNGGDLLCCDTCPKVFHFHCHVPEILSSPPGTWQCTLCRDVDKTVETESKYPKRKRATGFGLKELKLCEKLLLELFCHPQSVPFHHPVRASVPNYYKVIKEPIDLSKIKKRLQPSHFSHYELEKEFLQDIQLMFTNCFRFNADESTIYKMGKKLQKYFIERVKERIPALSDFLQQLMEEQKKYLEENPLPADMLDSTIGMPIFMFTDSHSEDSEDDVIGDVIEIEDDKDTIGLPNATSNDNNDMTTKETQKNQEDDAEDSSRKSFEENAAEKKAMKKPVERSKHVPYENDSAWEPDHEEDAIEEEEDSNHSDSDIIYSDDDLIDDSDDFHRDKRKHSKNALMHIN